MPIPIPKSAAMGLSRLTREAAEQSAKKSPGNLLLNGLASFLVAALIAGGVRLLTSGGDKKEDSKNISEWVFAIVFILLLYLNPW